MAQHDYVIANDTAANVRSDLNDALSAIVSQNSGASAPSTTYANMLWYDTSNNILKMRSAADDAWINIGYLDQTANAFRILDDTQVTNTSGTQTGLLGDQSTATWETGTSTTESLVSPAKVKAAIDANASGGTTTLGTLNTTSGTSVTLSGLDLTNYSRLHAYFEGVSSTGSSSTSLLLNSNSIAVVTVLDSADAATGGVSIDLGTGVFFASSTNYRSGGGTSTNGYGGQSGLSTASTSITFTISANNFDAGSITIYGVS